MKCREARDLFVAWSNDEVTRSERQLLQTHVAGCPDCRTEWEELAQVRQRLNESLKARAAQAQPSGQAWTRLQSRLAQPQNPARRGRGLLPASRLASAAVLGVALFAASLSLNPLMRPRLMPEAATAVPTQVATATPVVDVRIVPALNSVVEEGARFDGAVDRIEDQGRERRVVAAPLPRQSRRAADRSEALDELEAPAEITTPPSGPRQPLN